MEYTVRAVRPTFPDPRGWFVTLDYDHADGSGHTHVLIAKGLTEREAEDVVTRWTPPTKEAS